MRASLVPGFILDQRRSGASGGRFEAAVLFLDISGFTKLTDELRTHGVEGAEVLGQILADSFGPVADLVAAHGGIIPLYAGDALAAVFPGHADAAARALAVAQRLTILFGIDGLALNTRFGQHVIHLKVGLGLGEVEWGIPTDGVQSTFYFRGPGIDAAVAAQQHARPGYPGGLDELEELTGDMAAPPSVPTEAPDREDLVPFVGDALLDPALGAAFRPVWPVFLAFEPIETEALHAWVARGMTLAREAGLTFSQLDFGDKGGNLILFAGAPKTLERGGERVVHWLEALRQEPGPAWRAGVTHGILWTGFRGGAARLEYGVMGNAINLAARLCMLAPVGEVWVGPQAAERLRAPLQDRGVHAIKGRGELPAKALSTAPVDPLGRRQPFVGRQAELATLASELERVRAGEPRRIWVEGEGGIGKSVLVEALELQCRERGEPAFLRVTADVLRQAALQPLLALVARLLPGLDDLELSEDLQRLRSVLEWSVGNQDPDSPAGRMEPKLRAANLRRAMGLLLQAMVHAGHRVLLVEDAQWLDADSVAVLQDLGADLPMLFVATARPSESGTPWPLQEASDRVLRIEALGADAVVELVRACLGTDPDPTLTRRLLDETGGNPLFLEELAFDFQSRGLLETLDGQLTLRPGATVEVPGGLAELLVSRIDRLSADIRQVVQTAAVLGREFDVRVLSQMLLLDPTDARVHAAEEQRIWGLVSRLRYVFRHALLRDAAYSMQLRRSLRELHELAATSLKQVYAGDLRAHHAEIAHHYREAERPEQELHHLVEAARIAREDHANPDAIRYYDRAVEVCSDVETRRELLNHRAKTHVHLGNTVEAARDVEALEALVADDSAWLAYAERHRCELAMLGSRFEEMVACSDRSEDHARRAGNLQLALEAKHKGAVGLLRLGRYDEARARLDETLADARSHGLEREILYCLSTLGLIHMERNEFDVAVVKNQEILDLARPGTINAATAYVNLGLCWMNLLDYPRAMADMEQGYAILTEMGNRHGASVALNNMGAIAALSGDLPTARKHGARALALKRSMGDRRGEGFCFISLAEIDVRAGLPAEALAKSRTAFEIFESVGNLYGRMASSLQQSVILEVAYRFEDALPVLQRARALSTEVGNTKNAAQTWLAEARCHFALGRNDLAGLAVREAVSSGFDEARARALQARIDGDSAEASRAVELAKTSDERVQALGAAVELGVGDPDAFEAAFAEHDPPDLMALHGVARALGGRWTAELARVQARVLDGFQREEDRERARECRYFA